VQTTDVAKRSTHKIFYSENMKSRGHLGDLGSDGRRVLKLIWKN